MAPFGPHEAPPLRLRLLLHAVPSPSVVGVTNGEEYCTFILFSGMKKIKESQIPAKLRL